MTKVAKTKGHRKALLKQELVCGICLEPILNPETATVDHIVPLSLGGSNHRDNVQLAHPKCNRKKGNDPDFVHINLRKTRCPNCGRWYKNLTVHQSIKHPKGVDMSKRPHVKYDKTDLEIVRMVSRQLAPDSPQPTGSQANDKKGKQK